MKNYPCEQWSARSARETNSRRLVDTNDFLFWGSSLGKEDPSTIARGSQKRRGIMCCLTETERPIGLVGWLGGEKYQD